MKPLATIMVTLIAPSVLQVSGIVGEPAGWGQSRPDSVVLQTITGEVSSVVGEFHMAKNSDGRDTLEIFDRSYFVRNQAGETIRLELTDHTRVERRVNPGDRIEATMSREGYALSVIRVE
ncbi:MAG: hypothetical protein KF814_10780 [Nitrospiraceae bacterium]|mgnify:CR=1 FL=1|nr:hypothetical protein [Nitrospiraceae bacterium]